MSYNSIRRRLLKIIGLASLSGVASVTAHAKALKTATSAEGPFYPTPGMRYPDIDNDLVKIEGRVTDAGGEIIRLNGTLINVDTSPLVGSRVEIWQCDVNGRYLHTGDGNSQPIDESFQGFGHTVTNQDGKFSFRTIKPVTYPGRTPHIHVKVLGENKTLTSQVYIKDHAQNMRDPLFRRMSDEEQRSVEMSFTVNENGEQSTDIQLVV